MIEVGKKLMMIADAGRAITAANDLLINPELSDDLVGHTGACLLKSFTALMRSGDPELIQYGQEVAIVYATLFATKTGAWDVG